MISEIGCRKHCHKVSQLAQWLSVASFTLFLRQLCIHDIKEAVHATGWARTVLCVTASVANHH